MVVGVVVMGVVVVGGMAGAPDVAEATRAARRAAPASLVLAMLSGR